MNGIRAETYARRCAEDELRAGHDVDEQPTGLRERIRALVFVGLLDAEVAAGILSGYGRARELRGLEGYAEYEPDDQPEVADPGRVARCSGEIDVSGTTIAPRLVVLRTQGTRMAVTIRPGSGAGPGRGRRHRPPPYFDVAEITLRDDRGRSVTAHLSGGGGGREWRGWYEAEPGLSSDTAWIDVEGTRFPLDDTDAGATVTVETLHDADLPTAERASRYLQHCASSTYAGPAALTTIADTLVTCGALTSDSPAVTSVLGTEQHEAPHAMAFHGGGWWPGRPPHSGRGRQSATATVIVGVTTPSIDGVSITVSDLESTRDGFQVQMDGVGPVDFHPGYAPSIDTPRLSMRATDDLGNHYRSSPLEFEQEWQAFSGTVRFTPALDKAASVIDLEFSTERTRAIMHVPLQWTGPR